ncbi:hypothetical protein ACWC0C_07040 [Streptomyces sp. NPDC001709]
MASIPSPVPAPASGPEIVDEWARSGITWRPAAGRVDVLHAGKVIGLVQPSEEFAGAVEYHVVIRKGWPVRMPVGFLPPDPVAALASERARWLPTD